MAGWQKRLPNVPPREHTSTPKGHRDNLHRLTVEGHAHLKHFIRNALLEEGVERVDEWVIGIDIALHELGESVSRGGWLPGLKRARKAHNDQRNAAKQELRKKERERLAEKQESKDGKGKGKSKEDKAAKSNKENIKEHVVEDPGPTKKRTLEEKRSLAMEHLRKLVSNPPLPSPKPSPKHLLLTLSPEGAWVPPRDMDFDVVPSNRICFFSPGMYSLPPAQATQDIDNTILYGLDEWDADFHGSLLDSLGLVGGTFMFRGLRSPDQFQYLSKVLRLSIFMRLSLLLEQNLLSNSHAELNFPAASAKTMTFSFTAPPEHSTPELKSRTPKPAPAPSGLWSFLTKKTGNLLHRAGHGSRLSAAEYRRTGSLDLSSTFTGRSPRASADHQREGSRSARMSFSASSGATLSSVEGEGQDSRDSDKDPPIVSAVARITASAPLLSTSAGVSFPPPPLLVDIAEKERQEPQRRLLGEEKIGLGSLLGWEGRQSRGRGMAGLAGFTRHQGITFLYTEYVPPPEKAAPPSAANAGSRTDEPKGMHDASAAPRANENAVSCGRSRWVSFRYFSRDGCDGEDTGCGDRVLGDAVEYLCAVGSGLCARVGCEVPESAHERVWIHGGVRISAAAVDYIGQEGDEKTETIWMWESCGVCEKFTSRKEMSDGVYLFSFAKYLELLIYSPALSKLAPPLCEHTSPPITNDVKELTRARFNIVRHFACRARSLRIRTSVVPDVFELRLPRLQVLRPHEADASSAGLAKVNKMKDMMDEKIRENNEEKRLLGREIKAWWQGVAEHIDKLEEVFSLHENISFHKSLPRLPSTVEYHDEDEQVGLATPKARLLALDPATDSRPNSAPPDTDALRSNGNASDPQSDASNSTSDPSLLLSNLRYSFQKTEQTLYGQLSRTSNANLNDVRRSFAFAAKGATRRLSAWQKKHSKTSKDGTAKVGKLETHEPEWWNSGCHAIPGGRVIVREGEWASIISFTLSALDYHRELTNLSAPNPASNPVNSLRSTATETPPSSAAPSASSNGSSAFSSGSFRPFSVAQPPPDPDSDGPAWYDAEVCSAVISRQERDPSGLLSLRDVLRHRRSLEASAATFFSASRFSPSRLGTISAGTRSVSLGTPPSAWAKPAVELSMQAADGTVSGLPETAESAEKILQELDLADGSRGGSLSSSFNSTYGCVETSIRRGKASSIISAESDSTVNAGSSVASPVLTTFPAEDIRGESSRSSTDSSTDPFDSQQSSISNDDSVHTDNSANEVLKPIPLAPKHIDNDSSKNSAESLSIEPTHSHQASSGTVTSVATSLTTTLTQAMRYLLSVGEIPRPASPAHHHRLLTLDSPAIDARPHIKYDWTVGKRLKFSCTVYYAKEFETLRKRCGVEDVMVKSLERSGNWAAEGGKSKSNFWKTEDDRFVIKTLVNAWNVADLQVLIDIAPSYFRHLETTASKPSVLAKLLGFYTIEIRNLESGTTQAKADLLVMENLFCNQKISRTFDLKGIQGRKVKATGSADVKRTLFDGEWIEGQQKVLTLVQPHSKLVLHEAIKADAEFLSRSNIMDYSLLLGIDEERRQIACGLVDTIGSYTFAKTLEYKAKQNLQSGKEVTVIPPNEYQERFVTAMSNYFLACPDKWSRPLQEPPFHGDLTLPSIL